MTKKSAEVEQITSNQIAEKLQRKIAAAKKNRSKLIAAVKENPSEENQKKLARIEKTIERDSDTVHSMTITAASAPFEMLLEMLPRIIESQDAEELLRLGDETFAAKTLQSLRALRNTIFDSTMMLSANEKVKEFTRRIDEVVSQGEERLAAKRQQAAARFPELARKFGAPAYEMPAAYKKMLAFLVGQIERRDQAAKDLKNVIPHKRQEFITNLAEADKIINESEEKLAQLYEAHQKKQQYLDSLRKMLASGSRTERYQMREYLKENPGQLPVVEKMMCEEFPAEADD